MYKSMLCMIKVCSEQGLCLIQFYVPNVQKGVGKNLAQECSSVKYGLIRAVGGAISINLEA